MLARRRLSMIARVLPLALLIGHLGAEAHAYSHLTDDPHGLPDTAQSCRACLSFAPLLSAVGGSQSVLVLNLGVTGTFVPIAEVLIPHGPSHRAFQSRAPPAPL